MLGSLHLYKLEKNVHWFFKLRHQNYTLHDKLESQWSGQFFCGSVYNS